MDGGIGADGARGGGGGGGGYYGGGGGGSGPQGAGGGGGSSFADISALCTAILDDSATGWSNGVGDLRIVETGESWVELEWDKVSDANVREEATWYEASVYADDALVSVARFVLDTDACALTHGIECCLLFLGPDPDVSVLVHSIGLCLLCFLVLTPR